MKAKWKNYFMDTAVRTSQLSKDNHTKVGAVITKDNYILSVGYNGAPKGFLDESIPKGANESLLLSKNTYMIHAELNAVLNYRGSLSDLKDSEVFVTVFPCHNCMLLLAQLGISKVYYLYDYRPEENEASKHIAELAKINIEKL